MMDRDAVAVTLAGLLHDVGKPFQRGRVQWSWNVKETMEDLLCPFNKKESYFSHRHVLWTYDFFERFPFLNFRVADRTDVQNLASNHHKPSDNDPMTTILSEADWLSAAGDRKRLAYVNDEADDFRTARLIPIFEEIALQHPVQGRAIDHRYPFAPLEPDEDSCFPEKKRSISVNEGVASYRKLCDAFFADMENLAQMEVFGSDADSGFRADLLVETVADLVKRYFWSVPSSTMDTQDISLYDHAVTTGALASALYVYHRETNTLSVDAIRDRNKKKFLLVAGDLSGIQRFIFDLTVDSAKGAAKMLRARSFLLTLLTEVLVVKILRGLGLTMMSRIMDAGGRFMLLLPNTPEAAQVVERAEQEIQEYLYTATYGELAMHLARQPIAPCELDSSRFGVTLARLAASVDKKKLRPFSHLLQEEPVFTNYLEKYDSALGVCGACGKHPARSDGERGPRCGHCDQLEKLGGYLVKSTAYLISEENLGLKQSIRLDGLNVNVYFMDVADQELTEQGSYLRKADAICDFVGRNHLIPTRPVANYVPIFDDTDRQDPRYESDELRNEVHPGGIKTFHHIACASRRAHPRKSGGFRGTTHLGILKADVDSLGLIFRYGLLEDNATQDRLTVSRYVQLSRMMNYFFSRVLAHYFGTNADCRDFYTVFAGGDDLFLLGPWNQIVEFVPKLDEMFSRYTTQNPDIHLSCAVTLCRPRQPVNYFAHVAEKELKKAKSYSEDKHVVRMFGTAVQAEQLPDLLHYGAFLDEMMQDEKLSLSFMYKLFRLAEMEHAFRKEGKVDQGNYRSLFQYLVDRTVRENVSDEDLEGVQRFLDPAIIRSARIPLTYAMYNNRH